MATTKYPWSRLVLLAMSTVLIAPYAASAQLAPQPVPLHRGCTGPIPPDYMVCKGPPVCKENGDGSEGVPEPGPLSPTEPPACSLTSNSRFQANALRDC